MKGMVWDIIGNVGDEMEYFWLDIFKPGQVNHNF